MKTTTKAAPDLARARKCPLPFGLATAAACTAAVLVGAGCLGDECIEEPDGTINCVVLANNTDLGDTYQYADDYDDDGSEDPYDNVPFARNINVLPPAP